MTWFKNIKLSELCPKTKIGRPKHYPMVEPNENMLFFIQASQNINSVVYEVNVLHDRLVNYNNPINIFWIKNHHDGSQEYVAINHIQRSLAYGCEYEEIDTDLFRFRLVAYKSLWFYVTKTKQKSFNAIIETKEGQVKVSHIYVYADGGGVFPQVQYAEIFGTFVVENTPYYDKITFD